MQMVSAPALDVLITLILSLHCHTFIPSGQLSTFLQGNFKPIYEPNSNGDPTKHLPKVTVSGNDVSVEIPHVMTEEHYIKFM